MRYIIVTSCHDCPYRRFYCQPTAGVQYYCKKLPNYIFTENQEIIPEICPLERGKQ